MVVDDCPSVLLLVDVLAETRGFCVKAGTPLKPISRASPAEVPEQYR